MIYILNILIILLLTFLGISFLPHLSLMAVVPLLPLYFIVGLTYFRRGFEPLLMAALAGILLDFFSSYPFGLYLGLFLGAAIAVRILFHEGMKELSFVSFLILNMSVILLYFVLQLIILSAGGVQITFNATVSPFIFFLLVNLVYITPIYFLNIWYFDKTKLIENYQKRR